MNGLNQLADEMRRLINEKRYAEARALLATIDDPNFNQIFRTKLDRMEADEAAVQGVIVPDTLPIPDNRDYSELDSLVQVNLFILSGDASLKSDSDIDTFYEHYNAFFDTLTVDDIPKLLALTKHSNKFIREDASDALMRIGTPLARAIVQSLHQVK